MIIQTDGSTNVTEGGNTDTYQLVLTYPPTQPVTIQLDNTLNQATAVAAVGGAKSLVFTTSNWSVPQTVVVTAVDDSAEIELSAPTAPVKVALPAPAGTGSSVTPGTPIAD